MTPKINFSKRDVMDNNCEERSGMHFVRQRGSGNTMVLTKRTWSIT